MPYSSFHDFISAAFPGLSWEHWAVMAGVAVAVVVAALRRSRIYASVALGLTVFAGLFILDTLVVSRWGQRVEPHPGPDLAAEFQRLLHGDPAQLFYMLFNVLAFLPFGLFFSEFLSASRPEMGDWRRLGVVTVAAFGLSLVAECLQWGLRVGMFELSDLVLNALGALLGAALASGARALLKPLKKSR